MTFEEALERMKYDGARVKRKCWTDAYIFIGKENGDDGTITENLYCGRGASNKVYQIRNVTAEGILSEDWEVIK